jgi:CRP-like cAMP-binding protein
MNNFTQSGLYDLIKKGKKLPLKKGQLFQSSDHSLRMSLVSKGYIKRYTIQRDGSTSIQSIYGVGFIFPLTLAFRVLFDFEINSSNEAVYYEAMTSSEIFWISDEELKKAVQADEALYKDLLLASARRFQSNIQRLDNSVIDTAEKRIAHQLHFLALIYSKRTKNGAVIDVPLTHQTIAEIVNCSRETVSVSMSLLKDKKLVTTLPRQKIMVNNMEKLNAFAHS